MLKQKDFWILINKYKPCSKISAIHSHTFLMNNKNTNLFTPQQASRAWENRPWSTLCSWPTCIRVGNYRTSKTAWRARAALRWGARTLRSGESSWGWTSSTLPDSEGLSTAPSGWLIFIMFILIYIELVKLWFRTEFPKFF